MVLKLPLPYGSMGSMLRFVTSPAADCPHHHFRAAFEPMARTVIVVDGGGGLTWRDYRSLPYKRVRRPIYPLDLD